mmetsp:Transcript_111105/g.321123  ORF Transcript_111105/g.321123 Transcript_111105/m.321123 type:complete len:200 (-) Transcript_111105:1595-2194(-)
MSRCGNIIGRVHAPADVLHLAPQFLQRLQNQRLCRRHGAAASVQRISAGAGAVAGVRRRRLRRSRGAAQQVGQLVVAEPAGADRRHLHLVRGLHLEGQSCGPQAALLLLGHHHATFSLVRHLDGRRRLAGALLLRRTLPLLRWRPRDAGPALRRKHAGAPAAKHALHRHQELRHQLVNPLFDILAQLSDVLHPGLVPAA